MAACSGMKANSLQQVEDKAVKDIQRTEERPEKITGVKKGQGGHLLHC